MATALVTGGNRGIGLAICKGLIAKGIAVKMGVRDLSAAAPVAAEIGADAVHCDLTDPATHGAAEGVDILINNAGILGEGSMLDDPEGFAAHMQVMVEGPYHLIRRAAPHMAAQGFGRIVNVSSGWGSFAEGLEGPNAYRVANASLNALTKALVRDLPRTTKINAMCPGWVRTRMGGAGASLSPEEGADTAIWLATLPPSGPTGGFFRRRKMIEW